MSWPTGSLESIADVISGYAFKSTWFDKGQDKVIRISDFDNGIVDLSKAKTVDASENRVSEQFIAREGDVLMALSGATTGKIGVVGKSVDGAYVNQRVAIIRAKSPDSRSYIRYLFSGERLSSLLMTAGGAAQPNLSPKTLKSLLIPLPPLPEQKHIAAILDKADQLRQKRQQAIGLADEFLRSVFLDMFGDPVTNPKGWEKGPITKLAEVITGHPFKSVEYVEEGDDSVRLCRGANTLTGYFEWKDTAFWPKDKLSGLENYQINEGDVILAMDRPWISSGLKVCVADKNFKDTYLVQRVARLRPRQAIYSDFLYACIQSKAFEVHCSPTETTVPHISPVELKNFQVVLPNKDLVVKYHEVVSKIAAMKSMSIENQYCSSGLFNSLSQKAFAGEL